MSEEEKKTGIAEQEAGVLGKSAASDAEPSAGKEPPAGKKPSAGKEPSAGKKPSTGSSVAKVFSFMLLLAALIAGLGGGWLGLQAQQQLAAVATQQNLQLEKRIGDIARDFKAEVSQFNAEQRRQSQHIDSIQSLIDDHRQRLLELSTTDRKDWLLAEVEYLLRLANQRVLMAKDVIAAQALLRSADNILVEIKDVNMHSLRAALAADMAALRAAGDTDIQGTYLRLQALIGEIENLHLFVLPEAPAAKIKEEDNQDWRGRLNLGIEAALNKFSKYVTIRHREEVYSPALGPEWEGVVRQNLRMMLEQAQSALLSGNVELYSLSLEKSRHWVGRYFSFNEAAVAALSAELNSLLAVNVAPTLPDISSSLLAVKNKLDQKHQVSTNSSRAVEGDSQ